MISRSLGLAILGLALSAPMLAQQEPGADDMTSKRQKVIDELKARRDKHAWQRYLAPGIYNPNEDYASWPEGVQGTPAGLLAQKLADVLKKEVMVSRTVASRILREDEVEGTEAALTQALKTLGIRITKVGKETIVLTDAEN